MSDDQESRLTQNFLKLSDEALNAVPTLEQALAATINAHIDAHHISMGTVVTALACLVGEYVLMSGNESEALKKTFLQILDAYISAGRNGARSGPDNERSLVRRLRLWREGRFEQL